MPHLTPSSSRVKPVPSLAVALVLSCFAARAFAQATVYIVRHAEKVVDAAATDPPLTAAGARRARDLAKTLRSVKLSAIYATQYRRTQQTVAPAAERAKVKPTLVRSEATKALAASLRKRPRGEVVLVAAHSNTIPSLLRALGVKRRVTIGQTDYDNLFVVVPLGEGPPVFLHLHYGASTEAEEEGKGD